MAAIKESRYFIRVSFCLVLKKEAGIMMILEVAAEHPSPPALKLYRCGVKTSTT